MTPEQMRALADRAVQKDDGHFYSVPARDLIEYNAALRAAADQIQAVNREESMPCAAETHSWDHFRPEQVDSYWITCDLVRPHDEHEDQHTGLTWCDPSTIRDVTPPKEQS